METTIEELDPRLAHRGRAQTQEVRDKVSTIVDEPAYHEKLLKIATFSLPDEKGKAQSMRTNMVNFYGPRVEISGLRFSVITGTKGDEEYLAVQFLPEEIDDDAYSEWEMEKKIKAQEAKDRQAAKANGTK